MQDVDKKTEELQKKLEECEKQKAEYLAGWQRARADFLNYKKEEMERIGKLLKYAQEELVLKILPVLDNFEIAENKLPEDLKKDENVKGLILIKNQFEDFLRNQGLEEIKAVGEKFDPNLHEATEEVEPASAEDSSFVKTSADKSARQGEPGIILEEIQKGYTINGRLLRPAKVKVTK